MRNGVPSNILEYNGVHNLYAHPKKEKHSRLLLQAHADVVPTEKHAFSKKDGRYFGRGVYDMLFATACYLRLFDEIGSKIAKSDVSLLLSGDEETGGFNGAGAFLENGYTTDVCILPDAGEYFGAVNAAAKGFFSCTITIHGKAHHGSRPWEGDGAAIKLVHFLNEFEKSFSSNDREDSTMTVAMLRSGDADNKGPATAEAVLDIRYPSGNELERIKKTLNKKLKKYHGEIKETAVGSDYQLDVTHPDVQSFLEMYERHVGGKIVYKKAYGSSDARFFAAKDIPTIMFRPLGGGAHGDEEWISEEELEKFYQLLKEYVSELIQQSSNYAKTCNSHWSAGE